MVKNMIRDHIYKTLASNLASSATDDQHLLAPGIYALAGLTCRPVPPDQIPFFLNIFVSYLQSPNLPVRENALLGFTELIEHFNPFATPDTNTAESNRQLLISALKRLAVELSFVPIPFLVFLFIELLIFDL